jgi:hypothetical protein
MSARVPGSAMDFAIMPNSWGRKGESFTMLSKSVRRFATRASTSRSFTAMSSIGATLALK